MHFILCVSLIMAPCYQFPFSLHLHAIKSYYVACPLILYMPQEGQDTADLGVLLLTVMHFWWTEYSWCIVCTDKLTRISGRSGHC